MYKTTIAPSKNWSKSSIYKTIEHEIHDSKFMNHDLCGNNFKSNYTIQTQLFSTIHHYITPMPLNSTHP